MTLSADTIAGAAVATVGAILLAIATQAGWAGRPALAAPPTSAQSVPVAQVPPAASAPTTAAGGGVTLHSVSVDLPVSDRTFPGGDKADAINDNCLACHSAGMVLTQPSLSRGEWQAVVEKMRDTYKAPVAAEEVPAIVDYLASLKSGM